ncbi:hypothetical protein [Sphingosinicella microcystinivorans]|uniref:hypothetical protein n=1 Tax=Sphingosinicella microcystinivorans TaxID=335406 RepID=UPI0022F3B958|nr:hypothetical protein [Sphingosinicella microcystinivorans]WBX82447.1 hypothetical protein PE061_11435 [Sphingosinicella microcystinivorans]
MLVQTLVSVGGIALVVVLARWLGVRRPAAGLDTGTAATLAAGAIAGFEAGEVALDPGGGGALVSGRDGRFALIKPHGAQWTVRGLAPPVRATVENADLIVDSGDPMFGAVRLRIGAAAAETLAARLRAAAG